MKIKNIWIVTVSLAAIAITGMFTNNTEITGVAVGALAGWIGGNRNGQG